MNRTNKHEHLHYIDIDNRITKPDHQGGILVISHGSLLIDYRPGYYITYNTDHMTSATETKSIDKDYLHGLGIITGYYYNDDLGLYSNKTDFIRLYCQLRDEVSCLISQNTTEYQDKLITWITTNNLLYSKDGFGGILATNYTKSHYIRK